MSITRSDKVAAIVDLIDTVRRALGDRVKVVDHWEELESSESGNSGATLQQGVASRRQLMALLQRHLPVAEPGKARRATANARVTA